MKVMTTESAVSNTFLSFLAVLRRNQTNRGSRISIKTDLRGRSLSNDQHELSILIVPPSHNLFATLPCFISRADNSLESLDRVSPECDCCESDKKLWLLLLSQDKQGFL